MVVSSPSTAENVSRVGAATAAAPLPFVDLKAQQVRIRDRIDRAIANVLDHGQYIMGPEVARLEAGLASFSGARHVVSCASGTDALLIAMMALGVGPGDAVLCPGFTYTATPETIALLGATPVFVDVDPGTFNVAPSGVAGGLAAAKAAALRPVGLIAVDLFGLPADYGTLSGIAAQEGFWLVADAAQSFGAKSAGRGVGTMARVTATSFFPAKPLGCYGDGGALLTDDDRLAALMDSIRLHGKATGGDKYDIARIGINGRLDTLQAAILIEKLAIFADEIERRQRVAERYTAGLANVAATPRVPPGMTSVWAQYNLRVDAGKRDAIAACLKASGVPTAVYYPRPLHHQSAYQQYPVANGGLPWSERLPTEVLSLPMHPYLEAEEQEYIIESVRAAIAVA